MRNASRYLPDILSRGAVKINSLERCKSYWTEGYVNPRNNHKAIPSLVLATDPFLNQNRISRSIFPFWNYRVWQIYFHTSQLLSVLLFPFICLLSLVIEKPENQSCQEISWGIFRRMCKHSMWMTVSSQHLFCFVKYTFITDLPSITE